MNFKKYISYIFDSALIFIITTIVFFFIGINFGYETLAEIISSFTMSFKDINTNPVLVVKYPRLFQSMFTYLFVCSFNLFLFGIFIKKRRSFFSIIFKLDVTEQLKRAEFIPVLFLF